MLFLKFHLPRPIFAREYDLCRFPSFYLNIGLKNLPTMVQPCGLDQLAVARHVICCVVTDPLYPVAHVVIFTVLR